MDDSAEPVPMGVENWRLVNGLLRQLNKIMRVADASIEHLTRDVYYYLDFAYVRQRVDAIVEPAIPKEEPCVLVAHSLGTIVAYNILAARSEAGGDLSNIRTWVTLGSPLGIKSVYRRLPSGGGIRSAPFGVGSWYNVRDKVDVVALNEIPDNLFVAPPKVENSSHVKNGTDNHHGISGYLGEASGVRRIHRAARREALRARH